LGTDKGTKYQTLRIIAYSLGILAWLMLVIGIGFTIIIGMAAATVIARVAFVLGGLVVTSIFAVSLLASSKLIYMFIDMGEELNEIKGIIKENK